MKTFSIACVAGMVGSVAYGSSACSTTTGDDDVVPVDEDGVQQQTQLVYGAWTVDALAPTVGVSNVDPVNEYTIYGSATFTGPGAHAMGACLLKKYKNAGGNPQTCATAAADCPAPSGGNNFYCTSPVINGTKYCYVRPGPASTWCLGTPKTTLPTAPGSYNTSTFRLAKGSGETWLTYGCVEGCKTSDPNVSSASKGVPAGKGSPSSSSSSGF